MRSFRFWGHSQKMMEGLIELVDSSAVVAGARGNALMYEIEVMKVDMREPPSDSKEGTHPIPGDGEITHVSTIRRSVMPITWQIPSPSSVSKSGEWDYPFGDGTNFAPVAYCHTEHIDDHWFRHDRAAVAGWADAVKRVRDELTQLECRLNVITVQEVLGLPPIELPDLTPAELVGTQYGLARMFCQSADRDSTACFESAAASRVVCCLIECR